MAPSYLEGGASGKPGALQPVSEVLSIDSWSLVAVYGVIWHNNVFVGIKSS